MKQYTMENQTEVRITAENLETANLSEWERLELHLLDQAAVVTPGHMTVMEVIHVLEALQRFASDLLSAVIEACDRCDNCQMDKPCRLMTGPILPKVSIPDCVLEEAGLASDCKLVCIAEQGRGEVRIVKVDHRFDLTDLSSDLVDTFRVCKVCLADLEEKMMREEVVYGVAVEKVMKLPMRLKNQNDNGLSGGDML